MRMDRAPSGALDRSLISRRAFFYDFFIVIWLWLTMAGSKPVSPVTASFEQFWKF